MRILKSNVLLRIVNSYVVDSPQPANLSYLWNFGSLLAVCLIIQILTGCFLAMHYIPNVDLAFNSVEHIMRDVENGYVLRYTHANVASFFFIFVYAHIGRGLWYGSYRSPRTIVWSIGVIILVLMMATGFLGCNIYSPKWYKYNNYYKNYSKFSLNLTNLRNQNKNIRYYSTAPLRAEKQPFRSNISEEEGIALNNFLIEKNLSPKFIYETLNNKEIQNKIKKDTNNLSGVYLILNKETLDYYVGSASTNKFYSRFYRHLINYTGSKIVKLAVKKYGLNKFAFIILELFPEIVNVENNKKLLDLEDFYLKSLLPNYNILTEAGSSFGYKHTEITRIKMKANYSEERRKAIGNLNKGKTLSEETLLKMREKALLRSPRKFLPESLKNMQKKSKSIILYNISNNTVFGEFNSILEASKSLNCNEKTIRRALKTEKKILLKQWIVKYK